MKRFAVYQTAAAPLSRTLGGVALSLALMAVAAKRFGLVDMGVFLVAFAVAALVAFLAIATAFTAMRRIWVKGGYGLGSALAGLFIGSLALLPPVLFVGFMFWQTDLQDVSTDLQDPPELNLSGGATADPVLSWLYSAIEYTDRIAHAAPELSPAAVEERQSELYPDIVPRRYRIPPGRLHAASQKAVENLNWKIVDELPPDLLDAPTRLQMETRSPVLDLVRDIAIRIKPDPVGALLDVRSRSRSPLRDYSGNADLIRGVLKEVDKVLLATYGDLARVAVDEEELEDVETPTVEQPDREVIPLPGFKPYFEGEDGLSAQEFELNELEG